MYKDGHRRIMRLDELSSVVRLELRTMEDSPSRRIMRPLDKNDQCQSIKNSGRRGRDSVEEFGQAQF